MAGGSKEVPVSIEPPSYLSVNIYRARGGWYLVHRVMRAGGRTPRVLQRADERLLCSSNHSLKEACQVAADWLTQYAASGEDHS